jgi:TonB family protein
MYSTPDHGLFSLLPDRRPPWKEFVFSMGTQSVALLLLGWLAILHPQVLVSPNRDYHAIELVSTPVPVNHQPASVKVFKAPVMANLAPVPHEALRLPSEVTPKVQAETPAPQVEVAMAKPAPLPAAVPAIPRQLVKTNVFSTGSSATPTIARAPQQVQTGGFGDPNGVPARENNGKPVNIAQLGSFDLPTGAGNGNGTGGARGVRGVVASSGFGGDVATGDGSGRANATRGTVRQAGFGGSDPASVTAVKPKPAEVVPRQTPAEVLSKPTPVYTEEARKLHVEGEVLLDVVFEASGKLHVNRVIQGLGHGLDDAAIRAAEQIRFKPAMRDGQPADSNAVLHIVFQLA